MSVRFLSRLWKTNPQRLSTRLYTCSAVQYNTSIFRRQPLASQNFSHQKEWSRYFSYESSRDDIESSVDVDDSELLLETSYEPDDDDQHRLQLEIADDDALLILLQQCQSLEEV